MLSHALQKISSLQSFSRLAALLVDCKNFDGAVSALEDLVARMNADDASMPETKRRLADAKLALAKKRHADHYRLLGLPRNCPQEEVSLSSIHSLWESESDFCLGFLC